MSKLLRVLQDDGCKIVWKILEQTRRGHDLDEWRDNGGTIGLFRTFGDLSAARFIPSLRCDHQNTEGAQLSLRVIQVDTS